MSMLRPETVERLQRRYGMEQPVYVAEEQRQAIVRALREEPSHSSEPARPSSVSWRRMVGAVAAVVAAFVIVGTGVTSQAAIPGDLLYPVKLAVEPIQAWWDDDVAAAHRVDELVELLDRNADPDRIAEATERAHDAVDELPLGHPQRIRLAGIDTQIDDEAVDPPARTGDSEESNGERHPPARRDAEPDSSGRHDEPTRDTGTGDGDRGEPPPADVTDDADTVVRDERGSDRRRGDTGDSPPPSGRSAP